MSQRVQYHDIGTDAAKWNSAITHFVIYISARCDVRPFGEFHDRKQQKWKSIIHQQFLDILHVLSVSSSDSTYYI